MGVAAADGHLEVDAQRFVADAVVVHVVGVLVNAVGYLVQVGAHLGLGTVFQFGDAGPDGVGSVAIQELAQAALTDFEGGQVGLDVAAPFAGHADVGEDEFQEVFVEDAFAKQLDRRDAQSLLVDLGGAGGEAAGDHAADVRPVAAVGEEDEQLAVVEEGLHHADVHQVGSAGVGIVDEEEVALVDVVAVDGAQDGLGGELHYADEEGQAPASLGDDLTGVGFVDAVGEVVGLGDDRRKGGALHGQVHLFGDLFESAAHDRQGQGIDAHEAPSMMRQPLGWTRATVPGSRTVVASDCSMTAGPVSSAPAGSFSRS